MSINYPEFHKSIMGTLKNSGLIHHDHVHPMLILWVNFTEKSKDEFLKKIKEQDEDLYNELKEYLEGFDIEEESIPIDFPMDFASEEEFDSFFDFINEIQNIVYIPGYSVVSEISLSQEKEDQQDDEGFPALFSETEDNVCYLTVFDWDLNELEEYSGEFDADDENIVGLRLPIF